MKKIVSKTWKALTAAWLLAPAIVFAQVIDNPIPKVTSISELIIRITQWLLGLVGILALLALVVGGIRIIGAFGDEEKVRKGKTIIYWAVAGLVVVFLAYAVIITLSRTLGAV